MYVCIYITLVCTYCILETVIHIIIQNDKSSERLKFDGIFGFYLLTIVDVLLLKTRCYTSQTCHEEVT